MPSGSDQDEAALGGRNRAAEITSGFERGLYPDADGFGLPLYVSRGIGMEGGAPRVRFASRPEVALIELVPAGR